MSALLHDLVFSIRALMRAPLLLATSVLTLGIGIGVSTGVFAVAYGVLLRPLPFKDPTQLVVVHIYRASNPDGSIGIPLAEVEEWRRRARAFESLAAYNSAEFTLRGAGDPRSVRGAVVTEGFFETLGVQPVEGTTNDLTGSNPAAAFSTRLADQLGRDAGWRERGVSIGEGHFSVTAIMPRTFTYPSERIDFWVPAQSVPKIAFLSSEDHREFRLVARLPPGVSLAAADDDVRRVAGEFNEGLPEGRHRFATVKPLSDVLTRTARVNLVPFAIGAALVLLIACGNVSGLLVGRAAARRREFAVRRALGGDTIHVLRAAFSETFVIALAGWALGLWLAYLVIRAFVAFGSEAITNLHLVRLDETVVGASLVLSALVALASGAAPAARALRSDPGTALKSGSDRVAGGVGRLRGTLVVSQIALTVVLLIGAGLLTRTVINIIRAERGFQLEHALASRLMLTQTIRFNVSDRAQFISDLLREVRSVPGVVSAGVGSDLPPRGSQLMMTIRIVRDDGSDTFPLTFSAVTPGYLESIGVKLLAGRLFEERDRASEVPSVVISQAAARRMYRDREAVGAEWPATIPTAKGKVRPRVIGVVGDIKYDGLDKEAPASIFAPWEVFAPSQAYLVVRSAGDPLALSPAIRRIVQQLDPSLPVYTPESLEEVVAGSIAERRLRFQLAVAFAALALLLASVALWGAVAQGVIERRRELAIRMALGSTDAGAVRLILRGGVVLIVLGLGLGLAGAALSARGLGHLLHGIAPFDPVTFAGGALVVAALSLLACYAPARRAASVSPAELLREG